MAVDEAAVEFRIEAAASRSAPAGSEESVSAADGLAEIAAKIDRLEALVREGAEEPLRIVREILKVAQTTRAIDEQIFQYMKDSQIEFTD